MESIFQSFSPVYKNRILDTLYSFYGKLENLLVMVGNYNSSTGFFHQIKFRISKFYWDSNINVLQ